MNYTIEVFKRDARTKSGQRMFKKFDITDIKSPRDSVLLHYSKMYPAERGYRVEIHDTWITQRNLMTGTTFRERYDTPYFCSPSSESFWTM
jgi:hypothetical protein